jgi:hypothetical protein
LLVYHKKAQVYTYQFAFYLNEFSAYYPVTFWRFRDGRKGKLADFLQQKKKENYKVIIPKAIEQEVVDEPKEVAERILRSIIRDSQQNPRFCEKDQNCYEQDLIQVEAVRIL